MPADPPALPVVAVAASAGGVEALWGLLGALPRELPAAVLVVMHIPAHAGSKLADVLARCSALPVQPARHGQRVAASQVYVAVPDQHLLFEDGLLRLSRGPKECRSRPAADALFRSVAHARGPRAIGIVLSGMLDDGCAGLWTIKDRGGIALVQDPAEAICDSMPACAIANVAVDGVAPVGELAARTHREATRLSQPGIAAGRPSTAAEDIELRVAAGETGLEKQIMALGQPSQFTCPECHGVLTRIPEGSVVRFRCHTGHAYSRQTLRSELDDAIDDSLWNTIRVVEERLLLAEQAADTDPEGQQQLARTRDRLAALRGLVADERNGRTGSEGSAAPAPRS